MAPSAAPPSAWRPSCVTTSSSARPGGPHAWCVCAPAPSCARCHPPATNKPPTATRARSGSHFAVTTRALAVVFIVAQSADSNTACASSALFLHFFCRHAAGLFGSLHVGVRVRLPAPLGGEHPRRPGHLPHRRAPVPLPPVQPRAGGFGEGPTGASAGGFSCVQ